MPNSSQEEKGEKNAKLDRLQRRTAIVNEFISTEESYLKSLGLLQTVISYLQLISKVVMESFQKKKK